MLEAVATAMADGTLLRAAADGVFAYGVPQEKGDN